MEREQFEYVFEGGDFFATDDAAQDQADCDQQFGEVIYTSGSQTILLHNGEYYIQTDGETLLLGNEQDSVNQLVINESVDAPILEGAEEDEDDDNAVHYLEGGDDNDEGVVYKFTDGIRFVQNESLLDLPVDEAISAFDDALQPELKRMKMGSRLVEVDESQSVSFDVESHLRMLSEQEGLAKYQYAVLRDGRLHLQLSDADSVEVLNELVADEDVGALETENVVDLSKVTGRNLITGQTVTLDDYLERIHSKIAVTDLEGASVESGAKRAPTTKSFLNRKFTIGRTLTGKRLVGKILQIKTSLGRKEIADACVEEEFDVPETVETAPSENSGETSADRPEEFVKDVFATSRSNEDDSNQDVLQETTSLMDTNADYDCNNGVDSEDRQGVDSEDRQEVDSEDRQGVGSENRQGVDSEDRQGVDSEDKQEVDVHELVLDGTGRIVKVSEGRKSRYNEDVTSEQLEFLSKTLTGLADMESIRKKLLDKELLVKFVEKRFDWRTQKLGKVVIHLRGYLALQEAEGDDSNGPTRCEYLFVLKGGGDDEALGVDQRRSQNRRFEDRTSLGVIVTEDKVGHKTTRVNFYEKNDYPTACKVCGREFKSTVDLNRHVAMSHSDKATLTCHVCQAKFGDPVLLSKHRRHREHYFACTTCAKKFTTQSSLRRHLSVHDHSLRPLECSICGSRFTDESSLCKHLITHTGIRAYSCASCQKAFATVGDLNFHRRVHDPVKLFYCDVCGREFSRHSNLLRHAEIHKGSGDLYKCGVCGCSYKFISSLTRHVVQNHMAKT